MHTLVSSTDSAISGFHSVDKTRHCSGLTLSTAQIFPAISPVESPTIWTSKPSISDRRESCALRQFRSQPHRAQLNDTPVLVSQILVDSADLHVLALLTHTHSE